MDDSIYISKSDVLDLITEAYGSGSFTDYSDYSSLWDSVDDMPTADVQPVKHGKWEYNDKPIFGNPYGRYCCSLCGSAMDSRENNYCPNCGARMDGDTE